MLFLLLKSICVIGESKKTFEKFITTWKSVRRINMVSTEKTSEFSAAVRGYHYFRNIWSPQISETLECLHEFGNAFDMFAVKTCRSTGQTVGHLPREISRVTKFLLDRGAVVHATLTTTDYRRSPLVQGGLEIACKVTVKMPGTVKNHMLMDRYLELVTSLYAEPKNEVILGSFLSNVDVPSTSNDGKKAKKSAVPKKRQKPNRDIRTMFGAMERRQNENAQEKTDIIVLVE